MTDSNMIDHFRHTGASSIRAGGTREHTLIPFDQKDVVFQQMFEYPVSDFEAEVGFFDDVFGLPTIALTSEYALFRHPSEGYCFSFRKDGRLPAPSVIGLKLLFMTADIDAAVSHLDRTGLVPDLRIGEGSPVQRVIYFASPAGVAIEIWEDPSPGNHDA